MKYFPSFLLTFAFAIFTLGTGFSQTAASVSNISDDAVKSITVKVKGVGCATDLKTISKNVENLDGVNSCKTVKKGAVTTFKVSFAPGLVTEKEIHAAIENTGGCKNPNDRPYKVKL